MARLELYERGFCLRSNPSPFLHRKGGGKRGRLNGNYSSASFRRLREFVITHNALGDCWGLTLTVPGLDNMTVDEFKSLHHAFCSWLQLHNFPLVWRVELQRRGMPHLHCVFFGTVKDWLSICKEWFRLLEKRFVWNVVKVAPGQSELVELPRAWVDGASHAVNVQCLDGGFSAFRYLVAHMSKGKREQLGWAGRNWGVTTRRKFHLVSKSEIVLTESDYSVLLRWVRRWTRRKVYSRRGCSWWVSDSRVLSKMLDLVFIRDNDLPRVSPERGLSPVWLYSWFGLEWLSRLDFLQFDLVLAEMRRDALMCYSDIVCFFSLYYSYERIPF